jgi:predicted LPLAT superfamily acyltransferase
MNGSAPAAAPPATPHATPHAAPPARDWSQLRERSNLRALTVMRWIATLLGRRVARLVLHPITLYYMLSGGAAGRASAQYLQRLWGRPPRWRERYRHVHHFAATVLDRVYLLQDRHDDFDVRVAGGEHYDAVAHDGGGVLFVGAHLGSFEALRALGKYRRSLRVAMVMYEENARLINATLRAVAPHAELHVIALGRLDAMLGLRDWLDDGGVAGLLADRIPPGPRPAVHAMSTSPTTSAPAAASTAARAGLSARDDTVVLPFLGQPAAFHDGAFRLAAVLRRPMVFMAGLYRGGNRYDLVFLPVADFSSRVRGPGAGAALDRSIRQAMERYVAILESICREAPYNWFNFYDFWALEGTPGTGGPPAGTVPDTVSAGVPVPVPGATPRDAAALPAECPRDVHA